MISELNERSREIFREIVDSYLKTGDPVGSRTLSRRPGIDVSPATIRNVMADLEDLGLLFAPHTSAGRLPTEAGMRLFIDGFLEVGNLPQGERGRIEEQCAGTAHSVDSLLADATATLSGLSGCASIVFAPKSERPLKHIEFVNLNPGRALVVLVTETGVVENRILRLPEDVPASTLVQATNFLSARLVGRTIDQAYDEIMSELEDHRARLDELTRKVVESGLATWAGGVGSESEGSLIVRGQSNLLEDVSGTADLEQIRGLFETLETKEQMLKLLSLADTAEGVQIFIGADNDLFNVAGCSMIVESFKDSDERVIGAIGIIGPTRMNYARIIPMVDYTAKLIGRVIG